MELNVFQWKKKALSLAIQISVLSAPFSINAAPQVTATSGQVKNFDTLSWNGVSTGMVMQSKNKGSEINVTGTGTFNLSSGVRLFEAIDGGSVTLTGGGTINLQNTRMGYLNSPVYSTLDTIGGIFHIKNYEINVDMSGMTGDTAALELSNITRTTLSGEHRMENATVKFQGNGAERARFIHATGVNLTLLNTEIEANNGGGAVSITSMNNVPSNVSIIGGKYYGSNNYNLINGTGDNIGKRGSIIHIAGSSNVTLDDVYVSSDDEDNAMQLIAANLIIKNSTISGGNAGIFSYNGQATITSSNSFIEGRNGSAILLTGFQTNRSDILSSTNDIFTGKNGFRVEIYGKIDATLSHSLIQVDDAAFSIDKQGSLFHSAKIDVQLKDNSRIEATDAFKVSSLSSIINADIYNSQVNTRGKVALAEGGGQIVLRANASTLRGDLLENDDVEDSTLTAVLNNGSSLTGKSANVSSISLTNSAWNVTANSSVTDMYNNVDGNIVFVSPTNEALASDYKTLLVNGNYSGNGSMHFNTRLGDDNSLTDRMIVHGSTSDTTQVYVNNAGGSGGLTNNGILLIQVDGQSDGVFSLSNRVVAGMYQYDLFKNTGNGSWYLSSSVDPDWVEPTPSPSPAPNPSSNTTPTPSNSTTDRLIAPESGVYAHNMTVAAGMFRHTMYDRMGAVHNTYGSTEGDLQPGMWIRTVGTHTDSKGGGSQLNIDTDTTVVQLGGDVAQWTNGDERLFMGLMGGYGRSTIHAKNSLKPYTNSSIKNTASGSVEGYHVGAYATWLGNQSTLSGPYVDSWVQYGWFDNSVQGNGRAKESYDSRGLSASVETGYAFNADENETLSWMLEPQAQVIYSRYRADDFNDANGTRISDGKADGFTTRLGARFYSRSKPGKEAIQPFMEVNWWNDSAQGSQRFDGEKLSDGVPNNSYELKGGVQKSIAKGWQVWGHVNGIMGKDSYSTYGAMLGVKAQF
ncbi:autotransporter outer membrane beta-barrel domain-containing protein [Leminorella grimontii]|uniref:autotransporter family protein n=1 Tax=Leminorella grimontii TaxID=82981 RepID=UPI00321FE4A7